MRKGTRLRGDAGVIGGTEVLPFGVLIFVVGSLLAANAWAVVDAKLASTSAAREAARVYVEAPNQSAGSAQAATVARETVRNHGRNPDRLRLQIDHVGGRAWGRCTRVVVTVTYPVPALSLPWIGGYGNGFAVRASHSEIVDPFRAGLPGVAAC
jgi:hypothetical protein